MNLVIVESPTKARKLRGYLGSDFQIEASVGHIRDLPRKKLGVDVDDNFTPTYEVSPDKSKVISQLKRSAKDADTIYLATDPDREGEAIAWHITHILDGEKANTPKKYVRATFHEITKAAVLAAINKPSKINMDLVDAQQARRVVDRLVGYEVSPVLWKKVRRGLSAGRVQSVALRLIVEREKEIEAFKPEEYWEIDVALSAQEAAAKKVFKDNNAELPDQALVARVIELNKKKYEPKQESDVSELLEVLPAAQYTVASLEKKQRKRSSLPPFTTSTLQQAAATRLGMSSKQTMRLAQQLYEEGLITYHRTDSTNLSQESLSMARDYIARQFGDTYLPAKPRMFASKSKNAQEAHEAVRVTNVTQLAETVESVSGKMTDRHAKLYDLIWRRFLASQMPDALYDQTAIVIEAKPATAKTITSATLRSSGSVLKFDGWMRLFKSSDDVILPDVQEKQQLNYLDQNAAQKFTQPPARYNDASLVKELEKRGIGRPSTYASIISVIEDRGYVTRDAKRFVASAVGMTVSDYLVKNFPVFMEYAFTAEMEEDLDRISRGEKDWKKVVKDFYGPFHKKVDDAEQSDRVQVPVESTGEPCPKCGESDNGEIVIRSGRYGKFKSCSRFPDCDFTENIVEKVPNVVCPLCQQGEVIIKNSRWGKSFFGCSRYPECKWASWKQPQPGETMTQEEWEEQQRQREERKKAREAKYGKSKTTKKSSAAKKTTKKKTSAKKTTKKTTKKKASKK